VKGREQYRCEQTEHVVSRGTHHVINPSRPYAAFRTANDKSWAWRPGNEAKSATLQVAMLTSIPCKSRGMYFIPLDLQGAYLRYEIHTSVFAVCGCTDTAMIISVDTSYQSMYTVL